MSILDVIGCRHGTEKASNAFGCRHNYLPFYEQFLAPLRDKPIVLLEIGVDKGNSLRMWRDYFQCGTIIGMDCADLRSLSGERIKVEIGDQNQPADLAWFAKTYGPFDIVVDDAGHHPPSQKFCHQFMIPHIKPGGFYILEDLVGLKGPFPSSVCTDYLTALANMVMQFNHDNIESIAFSYGTSVTRIRSCLTPSK